MLATFRLLLRLVPALLILPVQVQAQTPDADPHWIRSEPSGCLVYLSPPPKHEAKARWTGGCVQGRAQGQGTLSFLSSEGDPLSYVGEVKAGRQHGRGVMKSKDTTWHGEWVEDAFTGEGRIKDAQCTTVGRFIKGAGHGSMRRDCPGMFSYHGDMRDDQRHGFGVLSLPNTQREAVESFERNKSGQRVGQNYVVAATWENDNLRFACASKTPSSRA